MADRYLIRPVTESDLSQLLAWRRQAHVCRWWGGQEVESESEKLREPRIAMWMVESNGSPLAFVQDYRVADWLPHHFDYLPEGARGLDLYIGDATMLGLGHGSGILRQHVDYLFARGVPAVGIDPHPENEIAQKAFLKAGFKMSGGPLDTRWGRAVLMDRYAQG